MFWLNKEKNNGSKSTLKCQLELSQAESWFQKGTLFLTHGDLRGSATTDMQGVESSILWSSSEDRQSLLCGGSVLSSESISSASNETK